MVAGWQPATGLERTLFEAIQRGNHDEYLRLLGNAVLFVPIQQDTNGNPTGWVTSVSGHRTYLLGYTSAEALTSAAGGRQVPYLTTSLTELARRWPDPQWWLAVNSGLPIEALVSPDYLVALLQAAPPSAPQPTRHTGAADPPATATPPPAGAPSQATPVAGATAPPAAGVPQGQVPPPGPHQEVDSAATTRLPGATPGGTPPGTSASPPTGAPPGPPSGPTDAPPGPPHTPAGAPADRPAATGDATDGAADVATHTVADAAGDATEIDELPDLADPDRFRPANDVEVAMLKAVERGDTDAYLKALMVAELVIPNSRGAGTGWPRVRISGSLALPLFTSVARFNDRYGDTPYQVKEAVAVLRDWPSTDLALALNPGTPVGAHLPGPQVAELAEWAKEIGLYDVLDAIDADGAPEDTADGAVDDALADQPDTEVPPSAVAPPADEPVGWLQKLLRPEHVDFYQQRGYHLVSGYVHPLRAVGEGIPPARLYQMLGLDGPESPFTNEDAYAHVVRWEAYGDGRYGDSGQRSSGGVVPQLRVAGVPLPHGALLVRIDRGGAETVVARFDADVRHWRQAEQEGS